MDKALILLIFVGIPLILVIIDDLLRARRLRRYWTRPCMGRDWQHRFPNSPKAEIRSFLEVFVKAFLFKSADRLKFNPNDKIMDIYRTMYTPSDIVDADELETFAATLMRKYGIDLTAVTDLKNITLGEVFELTRQPRQTEK